MWRNLPKLSGKLRILTISSVFIIHSCLDGLIHLLNFSLKLDYLKFDTCSILPSDFDYLIAAVATSKLKQLHFYNVLVDLVMAKSLAHVLTQSTMLEAVTVIDFPSFDCNVVRTLVGAMKHSRVKMLTVGIDCEKVVDDIPYSSDSVNFE